MKPVKCNKCKKVLFYNKNAKGIVEIKCPSCKEIRKINLGGKDG